MILNKIGIQRERTQIYARHPAAAEILVSGHEIVGRIDEACAQTFENPSFPGSSCRDARQPVSVAKQAPADLTAVRFEVSALLVP